MCDYPLSYTKQALNFSALNWWNRASRVLAMCVFIYIWRGMRA